MKEFVSFLSEMDDRGIGVIAVKNGLESQSSSGRMMLKMIRSCLKSGTERCSLNAPMQDLLGRLRMEPNWVANRF